MTDTQIRELVEREVEKQVRQAMRTDRDLLVRIREEQSRRVLGDSALQTRVEGLLSTR